MKLLYLYVQQWVERGIVPGSPLELNLVSGYKFSFRDCVLSLSVCDPLPDNFFSVADVVDNSNTEINAVSAIIGRNGTGKTSCAAVLGRLFKRGRHQPHYICIFQDMDDVLAYINFDRGESPNVSPAASAVSNIGKRWILVDDDEHLPHDRKCLSDVHHYENPFDVIYYSPYLPTADVWNDVKRDGFYDVSTGHYLLSHVLSDKGSVNNQLPIDVVAKLHLTDAQEMLIFAHRYVNDRRVLKSNAFELPLPRYAAIDILGYELLERIDYIPRGDEILINERRRANKQFQQINSVVCSDLEDNFVYRFVSELILGYAKHIRFEDDVNYCDQTVEQLIDLCVIIKNSPNGDLPISSFEKQDKSCCLAVNLSVLYALIGTLNKLCLEKSVSQSANRNRLIVDISSKKILDDVLDVGRLSSGLWRVHKVGESGESVRSPLSIELANMSSGEMAYWTLFSRIYAVIPQEYKRRAGNKKPPMKNLLVFLDEAETTLHPHWQQQLVRNILYFFEIFTCHLKVHIIFASHSPMVLSDIPKGNVTFLGSESDSSVMSSIDNTFGANIFDLYRLPFFMKDGTVGMFAQQRLDGLIFKIKQALKGEKCERITKDEWAITGLIGDVQARRYFDSVKPYVEEKQGVTLG